MPELPEVVRLSTQWKADLLLREAQQMQAMTLRWFQMEKSLIFAFEALAMEIDSLRVADQPVPRWKIVKMKRYQALLVQVSDELSRYEVYAAQLIADGQAERAVLGIEHAKEAIRSTFIANGGMAGAFDSLPIGAIETMVGMAGDGTPLNLLLRKKWPESVMQMTDALINATMLGVNPRKTAREMANALGVGLHKTMNIARTEQLRVYRESSRQQYQASGLVSGYKRLSARDSRTCAACLFADDGTIYPLDQPFEEHPQGRCTPVPVVSGLPEVQWQSGASWFTGQGADVQKGILGPGAYDAWADGEIKLEDMVSRRENATWGASLVPTSLKDLVHPPVTS